MSRTLGALVYDGAARLSRSLPHFRGKWQVVDLLNRVLLPLRGRGDDLRTVRMKDGSLMTWNLRDPAEGRAVWLGVWDDFIRDAVFAHLAPGAVILDVGASVGAWTVPLARRLGGAGRVYAFEPVPPNRERLKRAIESNALRNVTVSPLALGDDTRQVEMWLRSSTTGSDSGTAAVVPTGTGHLTVSMRTLDDWAAEVGLQRLDLIKLDVEGAEFFVLAGAERILRRFRPIILAEFDEYWISTHGRTIADVTRWAAEHDYRMLRWDRHRRCFSPVDVPGDDETLLVPIERG